MFSLTFSIARWSIWGQVAPLSMGSQGICGAVPFPVDSEQESTYRLLQAAGRIPASSLQGWDPCVLAGGQPGATLPSSGLAAFLLLLSRCHPPQPGMLGPACLTLWIFPAPSLQHLWFQSKFSACMGTAPAAEFSWVSGIWIQCIEVPALNVFPWWGVSSWLNFFLSGKVPWRLP